MFAYLKRNNSNISQKFYSGLRIRKSPGMVQFFKSQLKNKNMKTISSIISFGLLLTFSSCDYKKSSEDGYEKDRINSNTENVHLADSSKMHEPDSAAKNDNTITGELKDTTELTAPENK